MQATARILVTLDVRIRSQWSDGADIAQVRTEAIESGTTALQQLLRATDARIVGVPTVTVVLVEGL
jgi:hypothetical protein